MLLDRMRPVGLTVDDVVEQIYRRGCGTEGNHGQDCPDPGIGITDEARKDDWRQDEPILEPLHGPHAADDAVHCSILSRDPSRALHGPRLGRGETKLHVATI